MKVSTLSKPAPAPGGTLTFTHTIDQLSLAAAVKNALENPTPTTPKEVFTGVANLKILAEDWGLAVGSMCEASELIKGYKLEWPIVAPVETGELKEVGAGKWKKF